MSEKKIGQEERGKRGKREKDRGGERERETADRGKKERWRRRWRERRHPPLAKCDVGGVTARMKALVSADALARKQHGSSSSGQQRGRGSHGDFGGARRRFQRPGGGATMGMMMSGGAAVGSGGRGCEGRRRATRRTPARSREGTPARRSGDSGAATLSGSTGEGLVGLRHGGTYAAATADQCDAKELTSGGGGSGNGAGNVARCRADRSPTRQQQWTMEA
ncbi:hypothetical protein Scep_020242 [Stephania cephalantha]|uniref:Uncharacterized protein n=1 Tax=Stephania cephalantha TaxID=152367 RepID=A0AAP0ICE0_9MAGN